MEDIQKRLKNAVEVIEKHGPEGIPLRKAGLFYEALTEIDRLRSELTNRILSRRVDGWAVILRDNNSAPEGYWFVGTYTTKEVADEIANKQFTKGVEVRPIQFLNDGRPTNE